MIGTQKRRREAAILILAGVLLGGWGGHDRHLFSGVEARRLANITPVAPGWKWPSNSAKAYWDTSPPPPTTSDPLLRKFLHQTAHLVTVGEASKHWQDGNKLANLDIAVYEAVSDAHKSMSPFNALSEGLAARTGRVTKAAKTAGLGDEAWLMFVSGNGPQVTYHWRRDNLVFEAHIHCFGRCPNNIDHAARAWAQAIDSAARKHS